MARSLEEAATFSSTQFDYLIIGGGIGGLTLAARYIYSSCHRVLSSGIDTRDARLSEDTNISVGLLEAGKYLHDMPQISIPGYSPQNIGIPQVDWMFSTTPQKGLDGRKVPHARYESKHQGLTLEVNDFFVEARHWEVQLR